jgi:hypothetical protein
MNADIHLMCAVPATVNVYRAESSLSNTDSHFFPNISSCNLLNDCIINSEQIASNFRIPSENEAADFIGIVLKLIRNRICVRAWKFGIRKSEEWL